LFCGWTKEFEKRSFGSFVRVNLCELSFQVLSACPVKTPTLLDQENSIKQSIQFDSHTWTKQQWTTEEHKAMEQSSLEGSQSE